MTHKFNVEASFLLAAKLYELGKLSSGQSVKLCNMSRVAFLCALTRVGVLISNLREEDAAFEIEFFQNT